MEKYHDSYWHGYHRLNMYEVSDTELVEDYLKFFLRNSKDYNEFTKYFQTDYLKTLFYKVKLLAGETFENVAEIIGSHALEELTKSKEITICKCNNKFFKANEECSLLVDIKNI